MYIEHLKNKHTHKPVQTLLYKLIQTKTQTNTKAKKLLCFNDLKQTKTLEIIYFFFSVSETLVLN